MLEPDEQQVKRYGRAASSKKSTFHVSSAALNSAKGADLRHQAAKELASSFGALDTATVLRGFLEGVSILSWHTQ